MAQDEDSNSSGGFAIQKVIRKTLDRCSAEALALLDGMEASWVSRSFFNDFHEAVKKSIRQFRARFIAVIAPNPVHVLLDQTVKN